MYTEIIRIFAQSEGLESRFFSFRVLHRKETNQKKICANLRNLCPIKIKIERLGERTNYQGKPMNNLKSRLTKNIMPFLLTVSLLACTESNNMEEQTPPESPQPITPKVVLEGDDVVLARVNGSPITRYELELTILSTLGPSSAGRLDEAGRQKVLESLVAGRAIARVQEADMTAEEIAAIDKKTRAYREQLLVKQYLAKHVAPQPVTNEMVREYYESHPERFGARTIRTYEMLSGRRKMNAKERDTLIQVLKSNADQKDWQQWAGELQGQGYPIEYRRGRVAEKILHPRLNQLMRPLKKGETSQLTFIEGTAYAVRIVDEKQLAARPLNEVGAEIRKALVPVQLKKSVKLASQQVLQSADVVYEKK